MRIERRGRPLTVVAMAVFALVCTPALAEKPESAGQGKGKDKSHSEAPGSKGHGSSEKHGSDKGSEKSSHSNQGQTKLVAKKGVHFEERHRSVLNDWLRQEYDRGSCPPGLAKKHNGCMPPGQAKKWQVGHRLPDDVLYYSLPAYILRELGRAPDGHKYVRVGADILLLAIGTGMVIDAIEDLSSL